MNNLYTNVPNNYVYVTAAAGENNHVFNIYERMLWEFTHKKIGYRDMKHFYGVFKKITGKLPKDYR